MDQLMQKLALSKAIMDKTEGIKRGSVSQNEQPMISDFNVPTAKYNIPSDILDESSSKKQIPKDTKAPTVDAIKNSKLPDEIKRLMIEHPIQQPSMNQPVLSDDIIEKASKLMRDQNSNNYTPESAKQTKQLKKESNLDLSQLNEMVKSAVKEVLRENGLLLESVEKTNDIFSFKVGKHIFEGKVTKIKKIS